jgi:hypothetical protein
MAAGGWKERLDKGLKTKEGSRRPFPLREFAWVFMTKRRQAE